MLNRIVMIGRLTRDPELRTTQSGTAVTTFTVACDRDFANKATGEKETDFVPIVTWRGLAETCGKFLSKGKMVAVDGRLQISTYEDSEGAKRTVAEIVADTVQFLTPKSEGAPASNMHDIPAKQETLAEMAPMDDIPF